MEGLKSRAMKFSLGAVKQLPLGRINKARIQRSMRERKLNKHGREERVIAISGRAKDWMCFYISPKYKMYSENTRRS